MTDLMKAHTLLVIPSDDLRGMLDEGPCGFRPPTAWQDHDGKGNTWWRAGSKAAGIEEHDALALRWEGEWMPHGWLAVGQALGSRLLWDMSGSVHKSNMSHLIAALQAGGCTLIALDKQGKEMADD